jgi:hypothetical protein
MLLLICFAAEGCLRLRLGVNLIFSIGFHYEHNISNGDSATPGNITASRLVPEADRMDTVDKLFGLQYVLKLEPLVFQFAEHLAENYDYGYWAFYCLDSGGFYMAPLEQRIRD